jgi:DNA-binding transcriptional regulator YhcF (GntR family)
VTGEHPYQRIVADIEARIGSGELRPGDRVPSARQITARWQVAIATATRALTTLRQQGLVRAVPGVGTVVAARPDREPPPARRPATRSADDPELTRSAVVRVAVALADAEGMAAVSMRRIGTELGVATMSLYRHIGSKDDLVTDMIDMAIGEERLPVAGPAGWRARLELSARLQWRLFHRHPWLARAMSMTRPQLSPNALRHTEWALESVDGMNLSGEEMLHIHLLLFNFVRGLAVNIEPEEQARQDTGMTSDEWMDTQDARMAELSDSDTFRTFLRVVRSENFEFDLDSLFEFGLPRVLDGLAAFLRDRRPAA